MKQISYLIKVYNHQTYGKIEEKVEYTEIVIDMNTKRPKKKKTKMPKIIYHKICCGSYFPNRRMHSFIKCTKRNRVSDRYIPGEFPFERSRKKRSFHGTQSSNKGKGNIEKAAIQ